MPSNESRHQIGNVGAGARVVQGKDIRIYETISGTLTTALPGPIYAGLVPELPDGYRSREADLRTLKALLINSNQNTGIVARPRAAGLCGMGGVGKTLLAAALVHDPDVRLAFPYGIVWLTFGRAANAMAQLRVLARAVTGQPADYASVAEARVDLGRLLNGLRLLIVLDDVWEPGLVDGFRSIAPGCQLLITTRQQAVVDRANAHAHEVGLLDPRETRALLMEMLGTAELPAESDAVIGECGGLPLAIAAAAGMVRDSGWAHTREAFAHSLDALETGWLPASEQQNLQIVLDASVQMLKERERACFLECAIWPEDVAVPISALRLFWSAHAPNHFVQQQVAKALIAASVLQRGGGDTVRLHDLFHDYLRHVTADNLAAMHGALADRCVRFAPNGCELLDGSAWTLDHLPWHLLQAGRPEKAKALQLDYDWLASKLAVHGVQSLIADTHLVEDPELERLGSVLRLSAQILVRHPGQLSAQLLGRVHKPFGSGTAKLLTRAWEQPQDVLVPRGGKHLSEPGFLFAVFEGHSGPIRGALLLPDGRRALSWSDDATLRLWDLESGEGRPLQGDGGSVIGALLLPDDRRALSWSSDGTIRLWDLESGEGRPLQHHHGQIGGALLLPDGRRALSWSSDATLRLWDLESGEGRSLRGHGGSVNGALLLPDGRSALSWSSDSHGAMLGFWLADGKAPLWLWDLESGEGRPLQGYRGQIRGALLLPDGCRALTWSDDPRPLNARSRSSDSTLWLWDLEGGEGRPLQGHRAGVNGALLLPDGRRALSWSNPPFPRPRSADATLRLWDLESGEGRPLQGFSGLVNGALLLPDGHRALFWSVDATLRLWDLESSEWRPLQGPRGDRGVLLLPDGRRALSWSADATLRLWDLDSGQGRALQGHRAGVDGALLLPDSRRALSWSWDATMRLWDLESGEGRLPQGHGAGVFGALLLPDGRRALSWSGDATLRVWDLESGGGRPLQGHSAGVRGALPLPDGRRALSWSADATLRLWDLERGEGRPLRGHGAGISGTLLLTDGRRALSWSADPRRVPRPLPLRRDDFSSSYDHALRLWDLESGEGRSLQGHGGRIRGALLLPDGRRALSWSSDATLRLWDLESGEGRPLRGHGGSVNGALLLPDGRRALSWSDDPRYPSARYLDSSDLILRLWDLESGEGRPLRGHGGSVNSALLLPDGRRALSWSHEAPLQLWDLESGEGRPLRGHEGSVDGALLLPDGRRALSWSKPFFSSLPRSAEQPLWLWDLESGKGRPLQGHSGQIRGALLLPNGCRALSWSDDATLRLWDIERGEGWPLQGHRARVDGALLLPNGCRALSWSEDRTLRLWDLAERQELKRFVGDDFITTVVLSVQHQLLLAGDARGRIMIFDLPS